MVEQVQHDPAVLPTVSPSTPQSPKLQNVKISGFTPDGGNDKDDNTQLKITFSMDLGGGFVRKVADSGWTTGGGRFSDGAPWGPIVLNVLGTFFIDDVAKLKGVMEFQPNGDDSWKFTYELDFVFDDSSVVSKSGAGELSDERRACSL